MARSKFADKAFWVDLGDRALSTAAQAALGAFGADATGLLDVDPVGVLSVAGLAGLSSILLSVAVRGGVRPAE